MWERPPTSRRSDDVRLGLAASSTPRLAGEVHFVEGLFVSGNYFPALHVPPQIGRVFTERDDMRGCGPAGAVISHSYWQREFGGDPSVLSRTLSLDGDAFPIIGVTPPWFFGMEVGRMYDAAIPLCADDVFNAGSSRRDQRDQWWLAAAGRLKDGWTLERATEQLIALSPRLFESTLSSTYGATDAKNYLAFRFNAFTAASGVSNLRTNFAEPLTVLLATTGLVLLIACANLANLLLARASARSREMALRLAIGASRGRLIRQLMIESAVLALVGAALGAVVGGALSRVLRRAREVPALSWTRGTCGRVHRRVATRRVSAVRRRACPPRDGDVARQRLESGREPRAIGLRRALVRHKWRSLVLLPVRFSARARCSTCSRPIRFQP
jgi:hypothetical protein